MKNRNQNINSNNVQRTVGTKSDECGCVEMFYETPYTHTILLSYPYTHLRHRIE